MNEIHGLVDEAYEKRSTLTPQNAPTLLKEALLQTIELLDSGLLRVAEKINGEWRTHQWIKKAVLLYFRVFENRVITSEMTNYYDKVPLKFADLTEQEWRAQGVRVVPPAVVRKGAFIGANTVLMPSYVNIGA